MTHPADFRLIGGRITDAEGEPIMEISFDTEPEPLPLWREMLKAGMHAERCDPGTVRHSVAAEIEALRDHMLPPQPEPTAGSCLDQRRAIWRRDNQIRDYLTEQARIAMGD